MRPSHWTSSYNAQYRNQDGIISPNAGEPMYHFPGFTDPSHHQRDPGFYGVRASLAATARQGALQSGQPLPRSPVRGEGEVGYGSPPSAASRGGVGSGSRSFYAPPPARAVTNYSSMRQHGIAGEGLRTQRVGPPTYDSGSYEGAFGGGSARFGQSYASPERGQYGQGFGATQQPPLASSVRFSLSGQTDAPFATQSARFASPPPAQHYSHYSQQQPLQYPQQQRQPYQQPHPAFTSALSSSSSFHGSPYPSASFSSSSSTGVGFVDPAFADAPSDWRYDSRGVAQAKNVALDRQTDPRNKFHVPGYAGFVRGKQFAHGQTFAKTTRECLDVPVDLPAEIQY